jgi:hypothetical protein
LSRYQVVLIVAEGSVSRSRGARHMKKFSHCLISRTIIFVCHQRRHGRVQPQPQYLLQRHLSRPGANGFSVDAADTLGTNALIIGDTAGQAAVFNPTLKGFVTSGTKIGDAAGSTEGDAIVPFGGVDEAAVEIGVPTGDGRPGREHECRHDDDA